MRIKKMIGCGVIFFVSAFLVSCHSKHEQKKSWPTQLAHNPILWADVPDPALLRVGDTYYMSSTTMHMNPGIPIMVSKNLVNWRMLNYAYTQLSNDDASKLANGQSNYGWGTWASSLRYHAGRFYVSSFSNTTHKTYIFSTDNIQSGHWQGAEIDLLLHDSSLFFDGDRVFMIYGNDDINIIELTADASAVKQDGINQVLIKKPSRILGEKFWVASEGSQMLKVNGKYFLNLISWPAGGMRTQLIYRADTLLGDYEGRVAFADQGIAQGGLIDTPDGRWYAILFGDRGAVGRIPYLIPVHWKNDWPIYGDQGKVPDHLPIHVSHQNFKNIIESDNFSSSKKLKLAWQWNHNPIEAGWSLKIRPGYLRLTNTTIAQSLGFAPNTLTQRSFGPESHATTLIDASKMQDGDYAGLCALQSHYGFIGVEKTKEGFALVHAVGDSTHAGTQNKDSWTITDRIPIRQAKIYLRINMDFRDQKDLATFEYSLNGKQWLTFGDALSMKYSLAHFMGYRFGLFNFAKKSIGGSVDFDFMHLNQPK